jgi:hypothetical protein
MVLLRLLWQAQASARWLQDAQVASRDGSTQLGHWLQSGLARAPEHSLASVHHVGMQVGLQSQRTSGSQKRPRCLLLHGDSRQGQTCLTAWSASCTAQAASAWPRKRRARPGSSPASAAPASCWPDTRVAASQPQHRQASAVTHSAYLPVHMVWERACRQPVGS